MGCSMAFSGTWEKAETTMLVRMATSKILNFFIVVNFVFIIK
jgi:hypothetical protein